MSSDEKKSRTEIFRTEITKKIFAIIKNTGGTGGLLCPYKGPLLALPLKGVLKFSTALLFQAAAPVRLFIFAYLFGLPVNGSMYSFMLI